MGAAGQNRARALLPNGLAACVVVSAFTVNGERQVDPVAAFKVKVDGFHLHGRVAFGAAQISKPRTNLVLYAGVLAPNAKLRSEVVGHARPAPSPEKPLTESQTRAERDSWSELMRTTFGLDVLACPRCGGRLRYIATITDARVARHILEHLSRPARAPPETPARRPPSFWPEVQPDWA